MRMLHADNQIVSEGALETKQVGIGGDAKIAYAILTGMVTDKVSYALREPGTNAWEANPKVPFELTLPTRFSNVVRFRDFGPGLSHKFMMTRYPVIGESTKDGSDDAVGGWGFGSKAPLAYLMRSDGAGAFDVISRHKGFRRVYTIGINERGKLQASLIVEEPMDDTDRGTGLEVSYPVRPEDVQRFRDYADRIFWGFEPAPQIVDAPADQPLLGRGKIRAKGTAGGYPWRLYENDVPWYGLHVRIGPVLYPVDTDMLDGLTGFLQPDDRLCMDAPIGSLSVSASRETLSYDDRTKASLSAMFQAYEQSWVQGIQGHAAKAETYFEACAIAERHARLVGFSRWKELYERIDWRGIPCRRAVFQDTTSAAPWRACWTNGHTQFRAEKFSPWEINRARIVVEHSTYRSFERLQAVGVSSRTLWVRVKRPELLAFLAEFGLTADQVTVLDDVKLPKRVLDPKKPDTVLTKIRVRRQIGWNGEAFTGPVDLLAGGLYVRHQGRARYENHDIGEHVDLKSRSFTQLLRDIHLGNDFGLIPDDMPILVQARDEELDTSWTEIGDYLREAVLERLEVTKLTPRKSFTTSSFDSNLTKAAAFDLTLAPAGIATLVDEMRVLQKAVQAEIVLNDHDKLADYLTRFCGGLTIPAQINPCADVNARWQLLIKDHPLMKFILQEVYVYGNKAGTYNQKIMDTYFKLVAGA